MPIFNAKWPGVRFFSIRLTRIQSLIVFMLSGNSLACFCFLNLWLNFTRICLCATPSRATLLKERKPVCAPFGWRMVVRGESNRRYFQEGAGAFHLLRGENAGDEGGRSININGCADEIYAVATRKLAVASGRKVVADGKLASQVKLFASQTAVNSFLNWQSAKPGQRRIAQMRDAGFHIILRW